MARASQAGWTGALVLLVALAALVDPSAVDACAVCFGGEENDWTTGFVLGTVMMLSLPPVIVVGAGVTIYRSIKRHDAEIEAAEAAASGRKPAQG